jgi:hypothetical protein
MDYLPGNEPNSEASLKARAPILVQKNGVALPQKSVFDPWNLNSRGHQEADGSGPSGIAWKKNREQRLGIQLSGNDLMRKKNLDGSQQSILDCWSTKSNPAGIGAQNVEPTEFTEKQSNVEQRSSLFAGLVFYVNGSTYPHIGDHHLKSLISRHGGSMTLGLERKRVTHVILTPKISTALGAPSQHGFSPKTQSDVPPQFRSAGGGLAAGKLQKQIKVTRGPSLGIHFISPAWITESVKAGRRLPESGFSDWRMASEKQANILDKFYPQVKPASKPTYSK